MNPDWTKSIQGVWDKTKVLQRGAEEYSGIISLGFKSVVFIFIING